MVEAEQMAAEWHGEMQEIAMAWLDLVEVQEGEPLIKRDSAAWDAFLAGIEAGYIGTVQMLQKRGLLPTDDGTA